MSDGCPSPSKYHSGWLWKYSIGKNIFLPNNWKKRYFICSEGGIRYYSNETEQANDSYLGMVGWLQIVHVYDNVTSAIHNAANDVTKFYFAIRFLMGKKEFVLLLRDESAPSRAAWVRVLLQHTFCNGPDLRVLVKEEESDGSDTDCSPSPCSDKGSMVLRRRVGTEPSTIPAPQDEEVSTTLSMNPMLTKVKSLVSKNKKRFQNDEFDLDLSYVTDRIIAMGYPSEGREALYRNNYSDVEHFFRKYHRRSYKIYNLCSERYYPPTYFDGTFARYPFDDHNPPPLSLLTPLCEDMMNWLDTPAHVVAVHCKAGKGRTGVVIVAYLIYAKLCGTVEEAHALYNDTRTKDGKGISIPSQKRYVEYFHSLCHEVHPGMNATTIPRRPIQIRKIILDPVPTSCCSGGGTFTATLSGRALHHQHKPLGKYEGDVSKPYIVLGRCTIQVSTSGTRAEGMFMTEIQLEDDIRVDVDDANGQGIFHFWFHTTFVPKTGEVSFQKSELDDGVKNDALDQAFRVTLQYRALTPVDRIPEPLETLTRTSSVASKSSNSKPSSPVAKDLL